MQVNSPVPPPLNPHLNSRQQRVLWATVRHYVATAEPVGSKSLVDEYNLQVSPATIRNAMGALEKTGLLYQPHTSAGRVPSDSGYRIYVDQLMQPTETVAQDVNLLFDTQLDWEGSSLEALLKGAAQILSGLSGYITLITLPQTHTAALKHMQLVQVAPSQVLLVMVLDSYGTQSVLIRLPASAQAAHANPDQLDQELQLLSNFLNSQLRGQSLDAVAQINWDDLDREFLRYAETLKQAISDLAQRSQSSAATQIMVSGLAEVLRQPEFSESHQVQAIVRLLEEGQQQLWPLMFEASSLERPGKQLRILIGAENPLEPMQGCALVSSTYQRGAVSVGSVGMVGPTRMMYENAIALVEAAADYFSATLGVRMA